MRENTVTVDDLIWPIFVIDGSNASEPIAAMPGVERLTVDRAVEAAKQAADLGIPAIATFPNVPMDKRDETGSQILKADNLINAATQAIKRAVPQIGIITDVALDPFTSHGHDGILRDGHHRQRRDGGDSWRKPPCCRPQAGADIIAPSDMMDGRIGAIREALDGAGFHDVGIMSYATKFASAFYGPYREAVGTGGLLKGDKKTYYIDPANATEALREAAARPRRGRGHGDGEARPALSRHHRAGEGHVPDADLRLSGVGRIFDDHGRRREGLDRRASGR